jgi:periplasmic divalent cation tolerance protein
MIEARLIITNAGSREEAQKLASALLETQFAACVNIVGPMESHYWWKNKVEQSVEYLLLIKTVAAAVERVRQKIRQLHSYELPEFIVLNLDGGDGEYLEWITASVRNS